MREVDRIMIEELGIQFIQMMENAGRHLAEFVFERWDPARVTVVAGSGGNGGGGMVAARHLHNWGVDVEVILSSHPGSVPALQAGILERMGVSFVDPVGTPDLVIDALIGYSLDGAPTGRAAGLIQEIQAAGTTVVSLDVPSGVDVDTGRAPGVAVTAAGTVTLAAPKVGLLDSPYVGELVVADISVPPSVFRRLGLEMPDDVFGPAGVVSLGRGFDSGPTG